MIQAKTIELSIVAGNGQEPYSLMFVFPIPY